MSTKGYCVVWFFHDDLVRFQVHLPGDIHGRDDHQIDSEGLHTEQVHVFEEPVELARFRRHHVRVCYYRDGSREFGWIEDFPGAQGIEDCLHHAR